jgi:hypothetical protein
MQRLASALVALIGPAAVAGPFGTVFFTYDDPNGPPREFMYSEGDANSEGTITFNTNPTIDLVVDATETGQGIQEYQVHLSMNLTVGQATLVMGNAWQAPVSGSFAFNDGNDDVLSGDIMDGAFLTFGTTGNVSAGTATFSLVMMVSGAIADQLGGATLTAAFDASWSLSDFLPGSPTINPSGYLRSFVANTAFVGSAQIIPTPGASALLGIAGLLVVPRRRR